MTNDKLKRLEVYEKHLKERLSSPIPPKHAHRADTFTDYLNKELAATQRKIESLRYGTAK